MQKTRSVFAAFATGLLGLLLFCVCSGLPEAASADSAAQATAVPTAVPTVVPTFVPTAVPKLPTIASPNSASLLPNMAGAPVPTVAEPVLDVIPPPPTGVTPTAAVPGLPTGVSVTSAPAIPAPVAAALPLTPPAAVNGLTAPLYLTAVAGNRSVLLSWYPSEGSVAVSGYLIYRGRDPHHISPAAINLTPVTESNYSDSDADSAVGPKNRQAYFYRVRAYSTDGLLSPYSDIVSATPNGPLLPPGKVDAASEDGRVVLTWQAPLSTGDSDLSNLVLFKGGDPGSLAQYKILAPDTLRYTDKSAANGRPIYYAMASEDVKGRRSEQSPVVRAIPFHALDAPQNLTATGLGDDIVRLKWDASADNATFKFKGYNVYRSTGAAVDLGKPPLNKALVTDTHFEDESDDSTSGPVLGTTYTYQVVAVDVQDQASEPSAPAQAGPVASLTKLETGVVTITPGNTLQIQGRKTINMSDTWIVWRQNQTNTYGATASSQFNLDQQLQVRLTGQVGRKIKVDVDYDDKAAANAQQKISVVYTGDSQEVFKEFAFGDIQMDLTSARTEFAGYNKSLFGAKLKLDSPDERLRLTAIGAQTKGFTETKNFVGGYEQVKNGTVLGHDYQDLAFTPYHYYFLSRESDLMEGGNNIIPGSVTIYIDEPGITNTNPTRITAGPNTEGATFNFIPLNPNVDYIVDNKTGLITFNVPIQPGYNIAVAYKTAQGGSVGYASNGQFNFASGLEDNFVSGQTDSSHHLIQFGSQYGSQQYDGHMSCQFYNLGDRDILDPKLDPDFKLVIYGPNQAIVWQLDPRTDYTPVVDFDTRLGIMRFRVPYPFAKGNQYPQMALDTAFDQDTVALNSNQADAYDAVQRTNNFTIHVEYKHKLSSYSLRFNIIHGSEVITIDGRRMVRDVDYFLDYDTGILVFSNPDLVKTTSTVICSYEYLPFGGQFTSTIWGARAEYDLTKDLSVGSTYLSDSANAPQQTPDIKSGVYSLQILDGDVQAAVPQKVLDNALRPISRQSQFLQVKGSVEAAHSWFNPNTYSRNNENGVAMIDDFESVNAIVATSTLRTNWFPSSIPVLPGNLPSPQASDRTFTHLWTNLLTAHDASNRTLAGEDPSINMLQLDMGPYFTTGTKWDAYVYSFGPTPNQSISQSSLLQIWVQLKNIGSVNLHVDVGEINEDAVDNGVLQTESTTGILASGEDVGILTTGTSPKSPYPIPSISPGLYQDLQYWGAGNSILDTEDFDQTGVINLANNYYSYTAAVNTSAQSSSINNGFQELALDLTKFSVIGDTTQMSTVPGSSTFYTNIKRVRIWIDGASAPNGTLIIESIQFSGNKWQVRADPNLTNMAGTSVTADTTKFQVVAVNSSTAVSQSANVQYTPDLDFYTVDSTHSSSLEQALELQYALTNGDMSDGKPYYEARRILSNGSPIDFGTYQKLRVDIFKPWNTLQGETFLVRLAADDQDYFEYSIPLDSYTSGSWHSVSLALDGSDGTRTQVGQPYLRQINYAALAIRTFNNSLNYNIQTPLNQEALWVNNLRVTDSITREGTAQRYGVTYDFMKGGVVVNQSYHEVDSDFVRIDEQANPPARHSINQVVDTKVNVIPWLPASVNYTADELFTDGENEGDPLYSQNFVNPNQADNKTTAAVGYTQLPGLAVNATGYTQHIDQQYLPTYIQAEQILQNANFNPDNVQENRHVEADIAYKIPRKAYLLGYLLGDDQVKGEYDFDENTQSFYQQITFTSALGVPLVPQFVDTAKDTRQIKGAYSGSYKWGKWVTWTPGYSFSETEARGNIPAPSTGAGGTPYYTLNADGKLDNYEPQTRVINPALGIQFADLGPVTHNKLGYNFTQTMDYVRNEERTPGSVDFTSTLNPGAWVKDWKAIPSFDFSQSWQVDSTVNNDVLVRGPNQNAALDGWYTGTGSKGKGFNYAYKIVNPGGGTQSDYEYVPNIALESQASPLDSVWWIRTGNGPDFFGENLKDPLNIENVAEAASRRSNSTLTTHFDMNLFGWAATLTPRVGVTDARIMSAPEQITENDQYTYGSGLDFKDPHIPFHDYLKPQTLTLSGDYTIADNYVADPTIIGHNDLTSSRDSMNFRASLPTKPSDATSLTFSFTASDTDNSNYSVVADGGPPIKSSSYTLVPGIRLVYLITMSKPIRLPNFWPFYGREMRLKQAIRFDNDFHVTINGATQDASQASLPNTGSELYTLIDQLSYNVLENVKFNLGLEENLLEDPYASAQINQPGGYYTIKASVGLEATF